MKHYMGQNTNETSTLRVARNWLAAKLKFGNDQKIGTSRGLPNFCFQMYPNYVYLVYNHQKTIIRSIINHSY